MTELCRNCVANGFNVCEYSQGGFDIRQENRARYLGCKQRLVQVNQERQVAFKNLLEQIGGVPIGVETDLSRLSWAATLPTIDQWTRVFNMGQANEYAFGVTLIQPQIPQVLYMRISAQYLEAILIQGSSSYGWDKNEQNKGLVYGFPELPVPLDRMRRVLVNLNSTQSTKNGVHIPIANLDDHRALKPVLLENLF